MKDKSDYSPADITIYLPKTNTIYKDKSLLIYDKMTSRILLVGKEAEDATGRTEDHKMVSPFRRGAIADYTIATKMLKIFLGRAYQKAGIKHKILKEKRIVACYHVPLTEVDKVTLLNCIQNLGAASAMIVPGTIDSFIESLSNPLCTYEKRSAKD